MDLENLSISDAKSIQTDTANEFHGRYAQNDKTIVSAVSKAFERGVSGSQNFSNIAEAEVPPTAEYRGAATLRPSGPPAVAMEVGEPVPLQTPPTELPPEIVARNRTIEQNLRNDQKFGGNYQANVNVALDVAFDLLDDGSGDVEKVKDKIVAFAQKRGLTAQQETELIKQLWEIGGNSKILKW